MTNCYYSFVKLWTKLGRIVVFVCVLNQQSIQCYFKYIKKSSYFIVTPFIESETDIFFYKVYYCIDKANTIKHLVENSHVIFICCV